MNEEDWLAARDPREMIGFLEIYFEQVADDAGVKAVSRKLRLFAVGCCRHIAHLLTDARSRAALDWTERFVDGLAPGSERREIAHAAGEVTWDTVSNPSRHNAAHAAYRASRHNAAHAAYRATGDIRDEFTDAREAVQEASAAVSWVPDSNGYDCEFQDHTSQAERAFQANLLREVIGNPFRRVRLDPAWRTPTVLQLAQAAYDERRLPEGTLDPARLAILADALEDAGCTDPDILSHCREPGRHVRGCWLLDRLLAKDAALYREPRIREV